MKKRMLAALACAVAASLTLTACHSASAVELYRDADQKLSEMTKQYGSDFNMAMTLELSQDDKKQTVVVTRDVKTSKSGDKQKVSINQSAESDGEPVLIYDIYSDSDAVYSSVMGQVIKSSKNEDTNKTIQMIVDSVKRMEVPEDAEPTLEEIKEDGDLTTVTFSIDGNHAAEFLKDPLDNLLGSVEMGEKYGGSYTNTQDTDLTVILDKDGNIMTYKLETTFDLGTGEAGQVLTAVLTAEFNINPLTEEVEVTPPEGMDITKAKTLDQLLQFPPSSDTAE